MVLRYEATRKDGSHNGLEGTAQTLGAELKLARKRFAHLLRGSLMQKCVEELKGEAVPSPGTVGSTIDPSGVNKYQVGERSVRSKDTGSLRTPAFLGSG